MSGRAYTQAQRESAFMAWFEAGRPGLFAFQKSYTDPDTNLRIGYKALWGWKRAMGWEARADRLELPAVQRAEASMIEARSQMLERHRMEGVLLQRRGIEFLQQKKLTSGNEAIRAVETGILLERQVVGLPQLIAEITTMDTDALRNFVREQQEAEEQEQAGNLLLTTTDEE